MPGVSIAHLTNPCNSFLIIFIAKAIGLSDEKKVAPSWKKVFTKTKYRDGHVYGLVGWPEDLPYPKTNRKGKVDHDIEGLSTDDAKRVLKGFRDGVIDFKRLN